MTSRVWCTSVGSGTPVVFLHGSPVDHRAFASLDAVFADGGWRRHYPDLPGYGNSPGRADINGTDDLVDAVLDWLPEVVGTEPFVLVGSSYGGLLARAVTARMAPRVAGLALLAPVAMAERDQRRVPPRQVLSTDPALRAAVSATVLADYLEFAVRESHEGYELFAREIAPGLAAVDPAALARIEAGYGLGSPPEASAAAALDMPTMIVTGRQDHVVGFTDQTDLLDHYPRATYAVLDGAGHNLHHEQPVLVAALLAEWLGRVREHLT